MQYIFHRKNLEFLTQADIDFVIVDSKIADADWCVVDIIYCPDLIFKAFKAGVHCSINKINILDFA